jgi:hypothetical protein
VFQGTDQMGGAGVQNHVLKIDHHSYTNGETLEVSVVTELKSAFLSVCTFLEHM